MSTVLVLGATSDIAQAVARRFAKASYDLHLAARDPGQLEVLASDLRIRHQVTVQTTAFDAVQFASHAAFYHGLKPAPSVVIAVFGYLGDQAKGEKDWAEAHAILDTILHGG